MRMKLMSRKPSKQSSGCRCEVMEPRQLLSVVVEGRFQDAVTGTLDAAIAGKSLAVNGDFYAPAGSNTLNANNWVTLAGFDATAISRTYPTTTVITPDRLFAVQSKHHTASSATWVGSDGVAYTRGIAASVDVGWDIKLVKLSSPLPNTVGYAWLPPAGLETYLPNVSAGVPVLFTGKEKIAMVGDLWSLTYSTAKVRKSGVAQRAAFYQTPSDGSSGSPVLLLNPTGRLTLVSTWFDPTEGPAYDDYASDISNWIQANGGTVEFADMRTANIKIVGTAGNDVITVSQNGTAFTITVNGVQQVVDRIDIGSLSVYGGDGSDWIDINGVAVRSTMYGEGGNDSIYGGNGNDLIYGGIGNDGLWGRLGNDTLMGEDGVDTLSAGQGDDSLQGGPMGDSLAGNRGNDTLQASAGVDTLSGGYDNDTYLFTDRGVATTYTLLDTEVGDSDTLNFSGLTDGGAQINLAADVGTARYTNVTVNSDATTRAGIQTIIGTTLADSIDARSASAAMIIKGRGGNDVIYGGAGADTIWGGMGDDIIYALSGGVDVVDGGDGNDSAQADANDLLTSIETIL